MYKSYGNHLFRESRVKHLMVFLLVRLSRLYIFSIFLFIQLFSTYVFAASPVNTQDRTIKAAVPASFPPYYQLDSNGQPAGFAIDSMNAIAMRSGLQVEYKLMATWKEVFDAAKAGEVDLIPNVGASPGRKAFLDFTLPVEIFHISIFIRSDSNFTFYDSSQLSGANIGAVKTNIGSKIISKIDGVAATYYDSFEQALFALLAGHIDALAYPESVGWKLATQARQEREIKITGRPIAEIKRVMGVRKGNQSLLSTLNASIEEFVTSEEYRDIFNKWLANKPSFWTKKNISWLFGGIVLVVVLLSGYWRYQYVVTLKKKLDRMVVERTHALAASEKRFRGLFELSPLGIALNNYSTGDFVEINNALIAPTGYTREEFIKLNYWDITPEEYEKQEADQLEKLEKTGRYGPYEKEYIRKDGSRYPVLLNGMLLEDSSGNKIIWSIVEDISEQKRMQSELMGSRKMLRHVINTIPVRVFWKDRDLNYLGCNKLFLNDAGLINQDEIIGKNDLEMHWSDEAEHYRQDDIGVMASGNAKLNFEELKTTPSGKKIWIETSKIPLTDTDENIIGILGAYQDITLRKKYEEELVGAKNEAESANRTKSEFLSVISHELRTPLTSIKGALGLLSSGVITEKPEQVRDMLRIAYDNSDRLTLLVNDILDFEKLKSGKMVYRTELMAVAGLIEMAMEANQGYADNYAVHLAVIDNNCACSVLGDKTRLLQVLSNYISNAVKYSPKGGCVHISAECDVDRVRISVIDQGGGIPEEFQGRVFSQFSQADSSDAREKGGTGLGLAIAKEIIEHHGGSVGYDSPQGQGAIFYFELDVK